MKSGNEAFDDAIRKNLGNARVDPPEGVFEAITKQRRKRRLVWIWLPIAAMMLLTTGGLLYMKGSLKKGEHEKSVAHSGQSLEPSSRKAEIEQTGEAANPSAQAQKTIRNELPAAASDDAEANNLDVGKAQAQLQTSVNSARRKNYFVAYSGSTHHNRVYKGGEKSNEQTPDYVYLPKPETPAAPPFVYPAMLLTADLGATHQPTTVITRPVPGPPDLRGSSRFTLEISAGAWFPKLTEKATTSDTLAARLLAETKRNSHINTGFTAEAACFYILKRQFSAGVGVSYTTFTEEASYVFSTYSQSLKVDSITYYILFPFTPPIQVTDYDTTRNTLVHPHDIRHSVTYAFADVSGWVRWCMPAHRFTIEPQAGITVHAYTNIAANTNTESSVVNSPGAYHTKASFALTGALNASFACTEHLGLIFRGGYTWGLNPFATRSNLSELSASAFSASGGVRWNFSKRQATKKYNAGSDVVKR